MGVLTCVLCRAEVPVCQGTAKLLEHLQVGDSSQVATYLRGFKNLLLGGNPVAP